MSFTNQGLIQRLNQSTYQDQRVAVEFSCGDVLKKATGILRFVGNGTPNYIELTGNVKVKTTCLGCSNSIEFTNRVIIPLKDVCSVELLLTTGISG